MVRIRQNVGYGLTNALDQLALAPIVATRNPTTADQAPIGTTWINTTTNTAFALTSIGTWSSAAAAGATTVASLTVTGAGGINVSNAASTVTFAGNTINFTNAAGTTTITGNLTVAGTTTITGDLDLTAAALIDLTSTLNAAPSIYLHANGGVNEQILIHSDQGTAVDSVRILSDVGGLTLRATGLASADAINLESVVGGIDADAALQINIDSSQAAATAIRLNASAATGGIDIDAGTGGIAIDSTGAISIDGAAASNMSVSGAGIDLTLASAAGRVVVNGEEAAADAVRILSAAGGLDANVALQMNLDSSQAAAADSVRIVASAADGGIDIDSGTGGITIDSTGAFSIDGAAASNVTTTGAGIDLTLSSVLGSVLVRSTEDAALAIRLHANGGVTETIQLHSDQGTAVNSIDLLSDVGGITLTATGLASADAINLSAVAGGVDVDGALQVNITSSQAAVADSVRILASAADGGVDMDSGTGGFTIDSTGAVSIQGGAASDFSVGGAGIDLSLVSAAGRVVVNGEEAAADAVRILSAAGGLDADVALQMNLTSSQAAAADSIRILASAADGGIDIDSGTGGLTLDSTGAISIQGAAASDFSTTGAGIDLTLDATAGRVVVDGGEAAADAVRIVASDAGGGVDIDSGTGGVAIDSTAAFSIDGATASNVTVTGASQDLTLSAAGGSVNITATEAAADAIVLNASNAAGGIDLLTGGGEITIASAGNVSLQPATATVAGTSLTINARVGVATFTGTTTASGAQETFTITNSALGAGDGVFVTVSNRGTNDSRMTLERVNTQTAGSLVIDTQNNGAAATNGDVVIAFWIIN